MDPFSSKNFNGKPLDHLGLIADKIEDLQLIQKIDEKLPLSTGSKITMGERVAAMILNGLGFIDARLYVFPQFLEGLPVSRLFGREINPSWFNDDSLGRCLDAIADYGVTKLFTEISFSIGVEKNLLGKSAHFDTSTLQLWGEYEGNEKKVENPTDAASEISAAVPNRGYSKSNRHDLKQMVINLATTGEAAFPIWMESHSGNASDKTILPDAAERMKKFCSQLSAAPKFLYVGDSALYENILKKSSDMKWLTRVPEKSTVAKQFINRDDEILTWNILSENYSYHAESVMQGGVAQRWVLIFSKQAFKREVATLDKNIKKECAEYNKIFWHLSNEIFSCQSDAQISVNKSAKKMKYHKVTAKVLEIRGHEKGGRPKSDSQPIVKGYRVEYILEQDEKKIAVLHSRKGRFILASNELDEAKLPATDFLKEYKAQSGTESGFKFIKDDTFEVDSIFLKTPKRISALMMIMTLCLMVYGFSQYDLRKKLKSSGKTVLNQLKKPTDSPTMKWIYFLFRGAHELMITFDGVSKQIVINVSDVMREIIDYFGDRAKAIYFNSA